MTRCNYYLLYSTIFFTIPGILICPNWTCQFFLCTQSTFTLLPVHFLSELKSLFSIILRTFFVSIYIIVYLCVPSCVPSPVCPLLYTPSYVPPPMYPLLCTPSYVPSPMYPLLWPITGAVSMRVKWRDLESQEKFECVLTALETYHHPHQPNYSHFLVCEIL